MIDPKVGEVLAYGVRIGTVLECPWSWSWSGPLTLPAPVLTKGIKLKLEPGTKDPVSGTVLVVMEVCISVSETVD